MDRTMTSTASPMRTTHQEEDMTTTALTSRRQPPVFAGGGLLARATRYIVLWTIAAALFDELNDLRRDRGVR